MDIYLHGIYPFMCIFILSKIKQMGTSKPIDLNNIKLWSKKDRESFLENKSKEIQAAFNTLYCFFKEDTLLNDKENEGRVPSDLECEPSVEPQKVNDENSQQEESSLEKPIEEICENKKIVEEETNAEKPVDANEVKGSSKVNESIVDNYSLDNNEKIQQESNLNSQHEVSSPEEPIEDVITAEKPIIANEIVVSLQKKPVEENSFDAFKKKINEALHSLDIFKSKIKSLKIVLPNGKCGCEYRHKLDTDILTYSEIEDFYFENLEGLGLSFNKENNEISGIPKRAGNHVVKLKVKRKVLLGEIIVFDAEFNVLINPDPKSLWKNTPTPGNIAYYKLDSAFDFYTKDSQKGNDVKSMIAASQRGRSHANEGIPRDDDFVIKHRTEDDWYIMLVADGAGSAKYSRKGSEIACNSTYTNCIKYLNDTGVSLEESIINFKLDESKENRKHVGDSLYKVMVSSVFNAIKDIEKEAKNSDSAKKDFNTTLIFSICKKFDFGWFVASFWVGDGGIGIYNKDNQYLKILGESDGGEFAGQTRFITMPEFLDPTNLYKRLRFDIVEDFTAVVLMTDGITDAKFETDANLSKIGKWNALWDDISSEVKFYEGEEESAGQLLKWMDFWSPGNHDDRTIAILY